MAWNHSLIAEVLRSLVPRNPEEVGLLRDMVEYAESFPKRSYNEIVGSIPQEALKDFHGLVEALEVFRSIYGRPLAHADLEIGSEYVHTLRQIRDMCLEEGLRSIY